MNDTAHGSKIEAVLFDLDGTLIRARMTEFIPLYVQGLAGYCSSYVKPKKFIKAMLKTIHDLIYHEGDGFMTNEERLYRRMENDLGLPEEALRESLELFAKNDLTALQSLIRPIPLARQILLECRDKGLPLVLATNPVFPKFMIRARMAWADLDEELFRYVTSYENSHYCKPQAGYFREVADLLDVAPESCLMVGNDFSHDLAAVRVGMQAFLVDTWLVDRGEAEWPCLHRGDHASLQRFLNERLQ